MTDLWLDGEHLTIDEVVRVARNPAVQVAIAPAARTRMERSRAAVERFVAEGAVVYGITTGFGHFQDRTISPDHVRELQQNIVMSHATGVGTPLPRDVVRAMILVRVNTLAKGYSGIRPSVVDALLRLLNADVLPIVPCQGSLGASGDLAPLAHTALVLLGMGEAVPPNENPAHGQRISGAEALRLAKLEPITLEAKEGLALTNGTALLCGLAALAVHDAEQLCHAADIVAALSLEALAAVPAAFDSRLHAVRPHPRQIEAARYVRELLMDSTFVYPTSNPPLATHGPHKVQDAYSLRCVPQVHGAVRDAACYGHWAVEIELNSATDNPLILPADLDQPGDEYEAISGGNFHGEPLALAMDFLKLALCELGNISERRIARLVDTACNGGLLPPFLIRDGGLNSGLMLVQYTAAALASENKVLVHTWASACVPVPALWRTTHAYPVMCTASAGSSSACTAAMCSLMHTRTPWANNPSRCTRWCSTVRKSGARRPSRDCACRSMHGKATWKLRERIAARAGRVPSGRIGPGVQRPLGGTGICDDACIAPAWPVHLAGVGSRAGAPGCSGAVSRRSRPRRHLLPPLARRA